MRLADAGGRVGFCGSLEAGPFGDGYCPGFAGSLDGGTMFFSRM